MAAIPVNADPSFGISYKHTIGVEDLTVYQLLSNRDSLPIPTEADGTTPVFTEAVVTFYITQADTDVSSDWVISESASADTTITISDVNKTATVTAISADVGSFIIKAERSGYATITHKINVFKSKKGIDGSVLVTPDDETIENNGSGNLKVIKHTKYDTDYLDNILLIGDGAVVDISSDLSYISDNNLVISTDSADSVYMVNTHNSIVVGDGIVLGSNLRKNVSLDKLVIIAPDLSMGPDASVPITNASMLGVAGGLNTDCRISSYSTALGVAPINLVPNSTSISFPRGNGIIPTEEHNTMYFVQSSDYATAPALGVINIDLNDSDIDASTYIKARIDVYGYGVGAATNYYTSSSETTIINGAVITDVTTTAVATGGNLAGTAHDNTFSSGVLTTTITPGGSASGSYAWYATCQITVMHI